MTNPLLSFTDLPPFSAIKPEHVEPAITQAISDCRSAIEQVLADTSAPTWHSICVLLEESNDRLSRIWSAVSHMNSVINNQPLREAHDACLPLLSEYSTWVGQHLPLYEAYKAIKARDDFATLSTAAQKSVTNALRDFELSGIALPEEQQLRFGEISQRLSQLSSQFSNNVLDATMAWTKQVLDKNELSGLPQSALEAAQAKAQAKQLDGYLFTLDIPSYLPVMTYCDNQALRQEMYQAYVTRASDQGPHAGKFDNSNLINELLALKHELAQLLGLANYCERSLVTKMAKSPAQVFDFLDDLIEKARPQGQKEVAALQQFASEQFGIQTLNAWDYAYYSEKLKQQRYQISDEELRPYFPEERVIAGLYTVLKRVFNVEVTPRQNVETWHKDVDFYDIFDASGKLRGSFYLDLYARENKQGGAWMDVCRGRRLMSDQTLQTPIAYLTCNFNRPVGDKPALFTHDEVITLFHEFGHGIHHMLTQVDAPDVAGINGVPWDAVELPSQFLENWCWQEEALAFISGHYQTGEPLPKEMLDRMIAARNFQSAMTILRQLEFGLFDFTLHYQFDPKQNVDVVATLTKIKERVAVVQSPAWSRFAHSFGHIFAGGYSAGYYSYLWAEVLSADAFGRFEEEGIFNPETGASFLNNILEQGGSEDPMVLFERFRGRAPSTAALLRQRAIA
ncbi:MAG: oligopeptidase A [Vibrionaceae bacterium]